MGRRRSSRDIAIGVRAAAPQKPKTKSSVLAKRRGVVSARRPINDHESIEVLGAAKNRILRRYTDFPTEVARFYDARSLAVTIVGFSRFRDEHKRKGPPTEEIISRVESSHRDIEATLGRLGLYGRNGNERKLGFELFSPDLYEEELAIREEFSREGFALRRDVNARSQTPKMHVTVAELWADHEQKFNTSNRLNRLNEVAAVTGRLITLRPIYFSDDFRRGVAGRI